MNKQLKKGFYPAVGTPLDRQGNVIASSLTLHVEDQIQANASGLLVMGSMGIQAQVKQSEYAKVARIAVNAAKDTCPLMVGVMDNSIHRVLERIESLKGLELSGVVATTPFYFAMNQGEVKCFFETIAAASPYPIFMYDLPGVTKTKIEASTAIELMKNPKIIGMKTGDLALARILQREKEAWDPDFAIFFSGLDVFDVAYGYGLDKQLDGMFSCTSAINVHLYESLANGNIVEATSRLDEIILLRDTFVKVGVFSGFNYAMNLLGFEGSFSPDYSVSLTGEQEEQVRSCMQAIKLI